MTWRSLVFPANLVVLVLVSAFGGYQIGRKESGAHLHDVPKAEYIESKSIHLCSQKQYGCRLFIRRDANASLSQSGQSR